MECYDDNTEMLYCESGATKGECGMRAGCDLDVLVAEKVMGWEIVKGEYSLVCRTQDDFRLLIWIEPGRVVDNWGSFNPSTDIEAAWQVVEKFTKCGVAVHCCRHEEWGDDKWKCVLANPHPTGDIINFVARGDTAPEAICFAALAAVDQSRDSSNTVGV